MSHFPRADNHPPFSHHHQLNHPTPSKKRPLDEHKDQPDYVFAKPVSVAPTPRKTKRQSPGKKRKKKGKDMVTSTTSPVLMMMIPLLLLPNTRTIDHSKLSPSRSVDSALDDITRTPVSGTPHRRYDLSDPGRRKMKLSLVLMPCPPSFFFFLFLAG